METLILLLCLATSATANFFVYQNQSSVDASNVCIYSADPSKYTPKCFLCRNAVYPSALKACTNATTMPNNISYASATCIEKNCAINYPKAQVTASSWASAMSNPFGGFFNFWRGKRSIREGEGLEKNELDAPWKQTIPEDMREEQVQVIRQIETKAMSQEEIDKMQDVEYSG